MFFRSRDRRLVSRGLRRISRISLVRWNFRRVSLSLSFCRSSRLKAIELEQQFPFGGLARSPVHGCGRKIETVRERTCGARTSRINYTGGLISSRCSLGRAGRSGGCCTVAVIRGDRTAGRISGTFARLASDQPEVTRIQECASLSLPSCLSLSLSLSPLSMQIS